jgi:hypothetical protein
MLRVDRHEYDIAVPAFKLVQTVLKGEDFGGADERERCRYEKDHQPVRSSSVRVNVGAESDFYSN